MTIVRANHTSLTRVLPLFILVFLFSNVFSQKIPDRPNPPRLVVDFANILSPQQEKLLEDKLVTFNDTTSNQITVVTINSIGDNTPAMFAYEIGAKWHVGQKKFDNGIVVLVKPKLSSSDKGEAYIAVGYGLEPAIPDAIAKRIVTNEMIPYFKNNDYYGGINNATNVLMQFASGEINADGYNKKHKSSNGLVAFLPILIIFIVIILMKKSNGGGSTGIGGRSGNSFWTALMIGSMLGGNNSHSGNWGGFSGGSGGFGGGGGGFGGFGGGSFGGGGAGGSW